MPSSDTIDERLRSVDETATEAAKAPPSSDLRIFVEERRDAEEIIQRIRERYSRAGVEPDTLAATVRGGETAFRLEVTMGRAAAEKLYGERCAAKFPFYFAAQPSPVKNTPYALFLRAAQAKRPFYSQNTFARLLFKLGEQTSHNVLPEWMDTVLKMDQNEQTGHALDEMFDQINSLLTASEFDKVDRLVATMPVEGPSLSLMMGLLSITRAASDHLPSRTRFFDRLYRLCKAMRRDADVLLSNLK